MPDRALLKFHPCIKKTEAALILKILLLNRITGQPDLFRSNSEKGSNGTNPVSFPCGLVLKVLNLFQIYMVRAPPPPAHTTSITHFR